MWRENREGADVKTLQITIRDDDPSEETTYSPWATGQSIHKRKNAERSSRLIVKVIDENFPDQINLDLCARKLDQADILAVEDNNQPAKEDLYSYELNVNNFLSRANSSLDESVKTFDYKELLNELPSGTSFDTDLLNYSGGRMPHSNCKIGDMNGGLASAISEAMHVAETPECESTSAYVNSYEVGNSAANSQNSSRFNEKKIGNKIEIISKILTKKVENNLVSDEKKASTDRGAYDGAVTDSKKTDISLDQSLEKVKQNNARIMQNIHMLNRALDYTKKREILDIVCARSSGAFTCTTCGRSFVYESGLRRHEARHAGGAIAPRWQAVWPCAECQQVWPRRGAALAHGADCGAREPPREINASSLLQCEFCEKVFTSIPSLLRHSRGHCTARNYQCSPCGVAFAGYRAAERHWYSCTWLRNYYDFSLHKMLLCNVCDRKFRNYEQLYNHRYKAHHHSVKRHTEGMLELSAFQCEACGRWWPTAAQLVTHRESAHPVPLLRDTHTVQYPDARNDM